MPYPAFPTLGIGTFGPVATGSSKSTKAAVLTAKFGDRYSQRTGDGIHPITRDFTYLSALLPAAQIKLLDDFLLGRKGYLPFTFTPPYETAPRQFTCEAWDASHDKPVLTRLKATFQENFDP